MRPIELSEILDIARYEAEPLTETELGELSADFE
jgi:hypothetical protein